jgi:hypothetical protein
VYVRRAYRNGRLKCTKTEGSVRAVPLQEIALDAIARLPTGADTDLVFPSLRGSYFDLHNFRTREWKPAQLAAGVTPLRRVYDLRHTFATFALRAGISTFDLSRYMGASLTMIDRRYGYLAVTDANTQSSCSTATPGQTQATSTRWTPRGPFTTNSSPAAKTERSPKQEETEKPSDGLEPSTPSLPCSQGSLAYTRGHARHNSCCKSPPSGRDGCVARRRTCCF